MDAMTLIAERRIAEAQEEGAFDNLPGAGRPLELEDDSMVPEDLRMAYKVLRNAGYLPPQLDTAREIQTVMDLLENCADEREKYRQMQKRGKRRGRLGAAASDSDAGQTATRPVLTAG